MTRRRARPTRGWSIPADADRRDDPGPAPATCWPRTPTGTTPRAWSRCATARSGVRMSTARSSRHFSASGRALQRHLSAGRLACAKELVNRVPNRGMEGLTITPDGSTLVGLVQSALQQPDLNGSDAKNLPLVRIVTYSLRSHALHEFLFLLDNPKANGTAVSEITALSSSTFLADERDGSFPSRPAATRSSGRSTCPGPPLSAAAPELDGATTRPPPAAPLRRAGTGLAAPAAGPAASTARPAAGRVPPAADRRGGRGRVPGLRQLAALTPVSRARSASPALRPGRASPPGRPPAGPRPGRRAAGSWS